MVYIATITTANSLLRVSDSWCNVDYHAHENSTPTLLLESKPTLSAETSIYLWSQDYVGDRSTPDFTLTSISLSLSQHIYYFNYSLASLSFAAFVALQSPILINSLVLYYFLSLFIFRRKKTAKHQTTLCYYIFCSTWLAFSVEDFHSLLVSLTPDHSGWFLVQYRRFCGRVETRYHSRLNPLSSARLTGHVTFQRIFTLHVLVT